MTTSKPLSAEDHRRALARLVHECARTLAKLCDDAGRVEDAVHLRNLLVIVNLPVEVHGLPAPIQGTLITAPAPSPVVPASVKPYTARVNAFDEGEAPDIMQMAKVARALEDLKPEPSRDR